MKLPSALIISRAPRTGSRPDICSHIIDPRKRFTQPGEWPQIAHCNACGATVHLTEPAGEWGVLPAQMAAPDSQPRNSFGAYKNRHNTKEGKG